VYYTPPSSPTAPVYVFHHGAGSSALSFALVAAHLTAAISCGVIAFDARHHGSTIFDESADWDLSLRALASDEVEVVQGVAKHALWDTREDGWPDLILVGHRYHPKVSNHSLGGAVSAHVAANNLLPILCLTVIDVVEGSAMDALQSMQTYLNTRPQTFHSVEQGVQWHLSSRTVRNRESARVSVPALLVESEGHWKWRTDLGKTRPFWEGSFL
jgi:protein phosphatase methylesterase 1